MTTAQELRNLYSKEQLAFLDIVRQKMLEDPTALDNHTHSNKTKETPDASGQTTV